MDGRALVNKNDVFKSIDPDGKRLLLVVKHPEYTGCSIMRYLDLDLAVSKDALEILIEKYIDEFVEQANLWFNDIDKDESNHVCKGSNKAGGTQEADLNSPGDGSTEDSK